MAEEPLQPVKNPFTIEKLMQTRLEKTGEKKGLRNVFSLLPQLEQGITKLQYKGERPVFQLFTAQEALNGDCVWIDVENHSSTYALADTGGRQVLEKVSIGRAFTPFQHHQLCMNLEDFIDEATEMIALPSANGLYENGQIKTREGEELLEEALTHVKKLAEKKNLKILISDSAKAEGELEYLTGVYSQNSISVKQTGEGLRFSGQDFETLVYPDSGVLQTTIPLWMKKAGGEKENGKDKRHIQATPR